MNDATELEAWREFGRKYIEIKSIIPLPSESGTSADEETVRAFLESPTWDDAGRAHAAFDRLTEGRWLR